MPFMTVHGDSRFRKSTTEAVATAESQTDQAAHIPYCYTLAHGDAGDGWRSSGADLGEPAMCARDGFQQREIDT
jgi:hypothetical protein